MLKIFSPRRKDAGRAAHGQALLADFVAQGFVVHCDALTLARSTITQIVRRGLWSRKKTAAPSARSASIVIVRQQAHIAQKILLLPLLVGADVIQYQRLRQLKQTQMIVILPWHRACRPQGVFHVNRHQEQQFFQAVVAEGLLPCQRDKPFRWLFF